MRLRHNHGGWFPWLVLAVVLALAVGEILWMGDRVTAHRAERAADAHAPGKVLSLPLTGFKP